MLFVRAFLTSDQAEDVVRHLSKLDGVSHIARSRLVEPGREVVTCDIRPERADAAVAVFDQLEIPETDVLMARMSLIAPVGWRPNSRASLTTDSLVWADLLGEARVQARTVVRYLVFMVIAGIIAGFGVIDANTILIVGAMALSPDLLPVSAACVGLVTFRLRLAARATLTLVVGLGVATLAACLLTLFLDVTDHLPSGFTGADSGLGAVPTVNVETVGGRIRGRNRRDARVRDARGASRGRGHLGDHHPGGGVCRGRAGAGRRTPRHRLAQSAGRERVHAVAGRHAHAGSSEAGRRSPCKAVTPTAISARAVARNATSD